LQFKAYKDKETQDLLKKYKEHLAKAKLERNYYNKNAKLAEEYRNLVEQNYSALVSYCSIDAIAHYSYN
jgi:predicted anti-sigma-YlaC factor YlaD